MGVIVPMQWSQIFKQFAKEIFSAWTIINSPIDKDKISKYKHMKMFSKSIFLNKSLKKGSLIKYDDQI